MVHFFATRKGIVFTGLIIGIFAALLQVLGNPANMGICVACFLRDITGALGLHRADVVQYLRPEICGFVIGALISALLAGEFRPRGGSSPLMRFMLGVFAMIGALVFLGCPWRAILRLAGGDLNAVIGLAGLTTGIYIGVQFIKSGYNLGRSQKTYTASGLILPGLAAVLFILLLVKPELKTGALFLSVKGPGAMAAPVFISLAAGLVIGMLAQKTRFCTMGSIRDVILVRDFHLFSGVLALFIGAVIINLALKQVHPGFAAQPVTHTDHLWNFLGMMLSGLAFALAGGCPGRQLFMSGEGDCDAAIFVFGMIFGAAIAHNFAAASSPKGVGQLGPLLVIIGLVFCLVIGFFMRKKL